MSRRSDGCSEYLILLGLGKWGDKTTRQQILVPSLVISYDDEEERGGEGPP